MLHNAAVSKTKAYSLTAMINNGTSYSHLLVLTFNTQLTLFNYFLSTKEQEIVEKCNESNCFLKK